MAERLPDELWLRAKKEGFSAAESHVISFSGPEDLVSGADFSVVGHYVLQDAVEVAKPEPAVLVRPKTLPPKP